MLTHGTSTGSLYLNPSPFGDSKATYTISMIPTNSSGDIYHILTYVILAEHYKHAIPKVILTYDSQTTKVQVDRCLQFAELLGYKKYFLTPLEFNNDCYQSIPRQSALHKYFSKEKENVYYLDQKALTTLIANYFNEYGQKTATDIIRAGFNRRNEKIFTPEVSSVVNTKVDNWIKKLPGSISGKKFIILHIRHSADANSGQDFNPAFIGKFKNFLERKGYAVILIIASGVNPTRHLQSSSIDLSSAILPFENCIYKGVDYGKIIHIDILTRLLKLPRLKGIIGNTSGTLDLAAFIGHDIYNIHRFKNGKDAYQDYRVLIQTSFFAAEHYEESQFKPSVAGEVKDFTDKELSLILRNFFLWINSPVQNRLAPTIDFTEPTKIVRKKPQTDYKKTGYSELLFIKHWGKKAGAHEFKLGHTVSREDSVFYMEELPCTESTIDSIKERYVICRGSLITALADIPEIKGKDEKETKEIHHIVADYVGVALKR